MVELLRPDAAEHAEQRQQQRRRRGRGTGCRRGDATCSGTKGARARCRPRRRRPGRAPRRRATKPSVSSAADSGGISDVDDVALDLGDDERGRGVGEGVLHHRHDDQARRRGTPAKGTPRAIAHGAAQRQREDGEEQQRRDDRGGDGLGDRPSGSGAPRAWYSVHRPSQLTVPISRGKGGRCVLMVPFS